MSEQSTAYLARIANMSKTRKKKCKKRRISTKVARKSSSSFNTTTAISSSGENETLLPIERMNDDVDSDDEDGDDDSGDDNSGDDNICSKKHHQEVSMSSESKRKTLDDFKYIRTLGSGAYAEVYLVLEKKTKEYMAMKLVPILPIHGGIQTQAYMEAYYMKILDHGNLMKLNHFVLPKESNFSSFTEGITKNEEHQFSGGLYMGITMHFMETTLNKLISRNEQDGLPLSIIKYIIHECLNGIAYLHDCNLVHLDIKPDNILLSRGSVVLSDFGLTQYLEDEDPITKERYMQTKQCFVTLWYRPPEFITNTSSTCYRVTKKADIWSLGCVFAHMLNRKAIFDQSSPEDILAQIRFILSNEAKEFNTKRRKLRSIVTKKIQESATLDVQYYTQSSPVTNIKDQRVTDCFDLLEKMLQIDPQNRISAKNALKHKFFSSLPFVLQENQADRMLSKYVEVSNINDDSINQDLPSIPTSRTYTSHTYSASASDTIPPNPCSLTKTDSTQTYRHLFSSSKSPPLHISESTNGQPASSSNNWYVKLSKYSTPQQ